MGPCRIDPFGETGPKKGVCGATADTIVARGLVRMIAAGAAAHSDHGRDIAHTLLLTAQGKASGYEIKDEAKLHALAVEYGIATDGRAKEEIALDLAKAAYAEFGNQEGPHPVHAPGAGQARGALGKAGDRPARHRPRDRGVHAPHPHRRRQRPGEPDLARTADLHQRWLGRFHDRHRAL
jgi:hypothetical protein